MKRFFQLSDRGTTFGTEILGGATTLLAMAYIIVVNPSILQGATILAAVFGSLLMGLWANRPFAVAPSMGENAFLAYGLFAFGISWQQRLGSIFASGALFLVLTLLGLRRWLVKAVSRSMKHSFAVGIGLFLMLIGLYLMGVVTSFVEGMPAAMWLRPDGMLNRPPAPLKVGNLHDPSVLLGVGGFDFMCFVQKICHNCRPGVYGKVTDPVDEGAASTSRPGPEPYLRHAALPRPWSHP